MAGLSWRDFQLEAELEGRNPAKTILTLGPDTDPFAILDGNRRHAAWAQWFADLFHQAGYSGSVHLRRVHYRLVSQERPVPMVGSGAQDYAISPVWIVPRAGKKKCGEKAGDIRPNTYGNTNDCWQRLCKAGKWARHLGLIDAELIEDNRSPTAIVPANFGDEAFDDPDGTIGVNNDEWNDLSWRFWLHYGADLVVPGCPGLARAQTVGVDSDLRRCVHHLEIWIEKSSMNDILEPICGRHGIVLQSLVGESSLTRTVDLMRRIQNNGGKPTRIFYISDFDPAGNSMPAAASRRIEHLVSSEDPDMDVEVTHLALTREQVMEFNLPTIPIKESEVRADKFKERQNTDGAVELDALEALHPGVLAQMVEEAIAPYLQADEDWQSALREFEADLDERAEGVNSTVEEEFADQLAPHKKAYEEMVEWAQAKYRALREELDKGLEYWREAASPVFEAAAERVRQERPVGVDDPPDPEAAYGYDPLLDVQRDYCEQLDRYRQHKGVDQGATP